MASTGPRYERLAALRRRAESLEAGRSTRPCSQGIAHESERWPLRYEPLINFTPPRTPFPFSIDGGNPNISRKA